MAQRGKCMPRVLVLGIGNTIMSDDGVGAKVVQELQREYRFPAGVDVVDGGTLGLALLPLLEGKSHVIMVDAVETGKQPGFCVRLVGEELPSALDTKLSPHQLGLKDLLGAAQLMGRTLPELVLVGVQPKSLALGSELSAEVNLQVETMKGAVLKELERIGAHVEPVSPPPSYRWDQ
ncbi:Hydrogenase maturation protease [Citrifermentans bremense]|nr:Hydrogenase maturation protease [Citrifermentans bremense]